MNISVIIPVYNAERYLKKAVLSALKFDVVKEVILVEDASPDNALAICKELVESDERVKLFQHPNRENKGAGASRNLGMEKATMEYIAFLDADDYFLPNRFDLEIAQWRNNVPFDGMYSAIGVHFYTEVSRENFCQKFKVNPSVAEHHLTTMKSGVAPKDLFLALNNVQGHQSKGYFHLNGLTLGRKQILQYQLKFEEKLRLHQDTMFIFQCAYYLLLKEGDLKQAVAIRGIHDENRITDNNPKKQFESRILMFQELYAWASSNKISSVLPYYFYQLRFFQIKKGNAWNKWKVYFKLIFSNMHFYKAEEAKMIHYDLFSNRVIQKIYNTVYLRLNRVLVKFGNNSKV